MSTTDPVSEATLASLRNLARAADEVCAWPAQSWDVLCRAGVPAWPIPKQYGGLDIGAEEMLTGHALLTGACMTTTFILSQRDAAVHRILDSGNHSLLQELLPGLASGERFATVGLSQLTTSRQHGKPSLTGRLTSDALILSGSVPWVTGAARADWIVIGAVLDDGRQVLTALPRNEPGVRIDPPLPLMALEGSMTAEIHLDEVTLDRRWLLAGPAEKVMNVGRGGTGGLETSCLALGLARAAINHIEEESKRRPELEPIADRLEQSRKALFKEMLDLSQSGPVADWSTSLRGRANALVLQATQSALTASKGVGFVRDHPAQRWARQALFFLVWSCPRPAAEATLAFLSPTEGPCPW